MSFINRILLFCCFLVLSLSACDNELDLIEDKKETPIVYGLIDVLDTTHYVRVERSFIDQEVSALIIAQNADSLYFDDIEVHLDNTTTGTSVILQEVDGNTDGYPREDGIFAQAPNILYKVAAADFVVTSSDILELGIWQGDTKLADATCRVIEPVLLVRPAVNRESVQFNAANPAGIDVEFRHDDNSSVFDVTARLAIIEGGSTRFLDIPLATNTDKDEFRVPLADFYSRVGSQLRQLPVATRSLDFVQIIVRSAGNELSQYIAVGTANLGITSSQEIPTYTNINNGFGVFSSRSTIISRPLSATNATLDSLANGVFTRGLGFEF